MVVIDDRRLRAADAVGRSRVYTRSSILAIVNSGKSGGRRITVTHGGNGPIRVFASIDQVLVVLGPRLVLCPCASIGIILLCILPCPTFILPCKASGISVIGHLVTPVLIVTVLFRPLLVLFAGLALVGTVLAIGHDVPASLE